MVVSHQEGYVDYGEMVAGFMKTYQLAPVSPDIS
jgi:hypothetical protein